MTNASPPAAPAITRTIVLGAPAAISTSANTATITSDFGLANSWASISLPRSLLLLVRVTIRPAPSEMTNAGIWLTSPSPMVSLV